MVWMFLLFIEGRNGCGWEIFMGGIQRIRMDEPFGRAIFMYTFEHEVAIYSLNKVCAIPIIFPIQALLSLESHPNNRPLQLSHHATTAQTPFLAHKPLINSLSTNPTLRPILH